MTARFRSRPDDVRRLYPGRRWPATSTKPSRPSQVIEVQRLFGEPDYLLRFVTASLTAYLQLYDQSLVRLPGSWASDT